MKTQLNHPWLTVDDELVNLPGFYYQPLERAHLVELTWEERRGIVLNQGLSFASMMKEEDEDFVEYMNNSCIPTHRRIDVFLLPEQTVPVFLKDLNRNKEKLIELIEKVDKQEDPVTEILTNYEPPKPGMNPIVQLLLADIEAMYDRKHLQALESQTTWYEGMDDESKQPRVSKNLKVALDGSFGIAELEAFLYFLKKAAKKS